MSKHLLAVAIFLAYGPFVVMLLVYAIGLWLRATGRPGLLQLLVRRTEIPQPVQREEADSDQ